MPKRIQRRRTKGWKMPENTVCVDRSTPWGNPYKAGLNCDHQHAVDCHLYLLTQGKPARESPWPVLNEAEYLAFVRDNIDSLRGKNLACWCPLSEPCHADALLRLANKT